MKITEPKNRKAREKNDRNCNMPKGEERDRKIF